MKRPIVILHGWSDEARSFKKLARLLNERLNRPVQAIHLADYISMDDSITIMDLASAMQQAWLRANLSVKPGAIDVIVHSTGGLIIREWLTRYFKPETVPIKHLLMLAPANFGSPLAHKGRAFLGRLIKGIHSQKIFQTGTQILKALELASPYAWQLAERDRFAKENYYDVGKILTTVLVGNTGYDGIAAVANEVGGDGTVRIATSNLNCARIDVDFYSDPLKPTFSVKASKGLTAFGIMAAENHSTIAAKMTGFQNPETLNHICRALTITDDEFKPWCAQLKKQNECLKQKTADAALSLQNSVVFLTDQYQTHVDDYFIEFSNNHKKSAWFEEIFHQHIIETTHCYAEDKSFRSLYINCDLIKMHLTQSSDELHMRLTALPEINQNKTVGYRSFDEAAVNALMFNQKQIAKLFSANRTILVKIMLRREQAAEIFKFK